MTVEKIVNQSVAIAKNCIRKEPETVTSVEEVEGEWRVTVEVLERKAVPDSQDLLGRYEIRLNKNGELIGWTQKILRRRCDTMLPAKGGEETS
jgi:hypothetical protein